MSASSFLEHIVGRRGTDDPRFKLAAAVAALGVLIFVSFLFLPLPRLSTLSTDERQAILENLSKMSAREDGTPLSKERKARILEGMTAPQ